MRRRRGTGRRSWSMNPETLAALHGACFRDAPRAWSAAEFATLLTQSQVFLIPGADGFALGRVAGPEAELMTLAVAPAARRQGLGRALLAEFERQAVLQGASEAFLEVAADNAAAGALYGAAGWVRAGLRPGYYGRGAARRDALVLRKGLGASGGRDVRARRKQLTGQGACDFTGRRIGDDRSGGGSL